jgi:hypothetical protein
MEVSNEIMMPSAKPFGDIYKATILIIGHDPRLRTSLSETEQVFFLDYLNKFDSPPSYGPNKKKYELAHAIWDYIDHLAKQHMPLDKLYMTNLCNQFLPSIHGQGTVLIPDELAQQGVEAIRKAARQGHFRVIVPMSVQTFYHLCRCGFLDEKQNDILHAFLRDAQPSSIKAAQGIYVTKGQAPFLNVCGHRFHHQGIPVIPVVHIKQWPLKARFVRYIIPMQNAQEEISTTLEERDNNVWLRRM